MPDLARTFFVVAGILTLTGVLILVHELGHYLAARALGRPVKTVAIGIGPRLLKRTDRHGTEWRLGLLPLAGFVAMGSDPERATGMAFKARPILVHLLITAAGPIANLAFSAILYAGLAGIFGETVILAVVNAVEAGSPAEAAGLRPGDTITAAGGVPVRTSEDMRPVLDSHADQPVRFEITRQGAPQMVTATLTRRERDGRAIGHLGIWSHETTTRHVSPLDALTLSLQRSWHGAAMVFSETARTVKIAAKPDPITAALQVANLPEPATEPGMQALIAVTAFVSIGFALSNLLPIPMLDGGAILVAIAELVRRKTVAQSTLAFANRAGAAVLVALFAIASLHGLVSR